jgi:hypothetical protein
MRCGQQSGSLLQSAGGSVYGPQISEGAVLGAPQKLGPSSGPPNR